MDAKSYNGEPGAMPYDRDYNPPGWDQAETLEIEDVGDGGAEREQLGTEPVMARLHRPLDQPFCQQRGEDRMCKVYCTPDRCRCHADCPDS